MLARLAVLLALFLFTDAHADSYIGLGASLAVTDLDTECASCTTYDIHKVSIQPTAFLGYRISNTALEAGLGYASLKAHAVLPSRPADMRQEIDSRFIYLAAIQFFPITTGEFFAGAGAAKVWARNYEHGLNRDDSTTDPAHYMTNQTYTKELAPYLTAGWQGEHIRLSASVIPNVIRSYWTRSEDIYQFSAAYVWR